MAVRTRDRLPLRAPVTTVPADAEDDDAGKIAGILSCILRSDTAALGDWMRGWLDGWMRGWMDGCVGEWGWGVEGKQVGSMDEESQVRGCYNITFICTPTNQETSVCIGKDTSKQNI